MVIFMDNPVYVFGHRNPDTDSICSAICYTRLKTLLTGKEHIAKRAGHLNEETQYVLSKNEVSIPEYIKDVRPQVRDVDIHIIEGVSEDISMKAAYHYMKENNTVTLPILSNGELEGLITLGDISKSYFDVYDSNILSVAHTSMQNIVDTLDATVITGDIGQIVDKGKVVIATANPDMMEQYIEEGDIIILGNRYDAQLCAVEMNARCIVICEGVNVSKTIIKVAQENNCMIITTEYDTYTVARLINQSLPIRFYMTPKEKMIKFKITDYIEDIEDTMAKRRFRDFPILDENGKYIGMISRRNLLKHGKKKLILVDHNEKSQAVFGVETAEILEIIDHHRLGSIQTMTPVFFRNQPLGCTSTIIGLMYEENGLIPEKTIAALLCSAIISDTLILKSPTCTQVDIDICKKMAQIANIDIESYGREMFKAGSNLVGRTSEELFARDFKKFSVNDIVIGVGQVNCMTKEETDMVRQPMIDYLSGDLSKMGLDMAFFMITNVLTESSEVVCFGNNSTQIITNSFSTVSDGNVVSLKGVVSRKKQLLPAIMEELQQ